MIVLSAQNLRKHFPGCPEPVLDGVTFEVRRGERIGLVGPNGSGKTTLLRILAGEEEADGGHYRRHGSIRLGYLEQQLRFQPGRTLWQEAADALEELVVLARQAIETADAMSKTDDPAQHDRLAARYDRLQHELDHRGAYNLDYKIERVLDGLGFSRESHQLPVDALSGGEQNRLMLAKLLLAEPDVMLLDEPSNHLDIEATEWLEGFLAGHAAAMLLVSHDRYFLDKVTNRTLELFHGTVDGYRGNFSAYWRQKDERLVVQQRAYEKRQDEIAKTKDFIRRNAYGQKHAQAEDRRKKLARLEPVPPPRQIAAPPMAFAPTGRSGDIVLRAEHLAKAYDRPLFKDLDIEIARGQRWAVLGPNGSGKTTLLRCLLGRVAPDAGRVIVGHGVRIGYFDQQLAAFEDTMQVVDCIRPEGKLLEEQQRRDLLARFGLTGQIVMQPVGSLSGGERCRAALARLAAAEANFLVLDEPTNHLDLWALDALEQAITRFEGTILMVSHDRYFVNRVADHLLVVQPERFRVIEGNWDTFLRLVERGSARLPDTARKESPTRPTVRKRDAKKTTGSKRRFSYRKVGDIEADIFDLETRVRQCHDALARDEVQRDGPRVRRLKADIAEHQAALAALYDHWDEATELNW